MDYKRGRYSWILRPILIIYDLAIINIFSNYFLKFNNRGLYFFSFEFLNDKNLLYLIYSVVFWLSSSKLLKFYKVYRYTSVLNIMLLLVKQFLVYSVIVYAFIGIFRSVNVSAFVTFKYLSYSFLAVSLVKLLSFYALKTYRLYLKGNIRNVIVIGNGSSALDLKKLFTEKKELGYNFVGIFSDANSEDFTGNIKDSFQLLETSNSIDEIYCSIDELTENEVNEYVKYANINHCNIKFISNDKKFVTKRLKTDYYDLLPVLSIQEVALNDDFNKFIKRSFDIVFSLSVIIFILPWVSIILFVLIKLESKGPLFYKHKRNGINYKEFDCYKFRSLKTVQEVKGTYVKPNDPRLTKIGKFLRRTNMDELPQFVNVLKGDMSVVGPRPHMLTYTDEYSKKIEKHNFIFRHHIKPGITGLAQISGFRGEVETDSDIINRIKYDIFYIENWSILLDMKIIVQTFMNALKGEDKAY